MSDYRTVLQISPSKIKVGLNDSILTIGSCFADNIGTQLKQNKFNALANPFGTTYNPLSFDKLIGYAIRNDFPEPDTYGELNETFFNYDFHSSFSALNRNAVELNIKNAIQETHRFLKSAKLLIITYGTSWVYKRSDNGAIVSNCHKVPGSHFNKELLTQKKILESFGNIYQPLIEFNPSLKLILTVSPVRHLKDTLELNAVSKSILRLSCHTLSETFPRVEYFPAYEIVLDDLRDYRFYDSDLLHPSPTAIDYIWKKFGERYFSDRTKDFIKKWTEVTKSITHRAYQPASAQHQAFLKRVLDQLLELKSVVNVDKEISLIKKQITG